MSAREISTPTLRRVLLVGSRVVVAIGWFVALVCAARMRAALQWPFAPLPANAATAWSIFTHNAHTLLAPLGAAVALQAPWLTARGHTTEPGLIWKGIRAFCDVALAMLALRNLAVLAVGLGAYGSRMAIAVLPHGPVELLACAQLATLYLRARRGPLAPRAWLTHGALAFLTLAVAAALETFVGS